MTRFLLLPLYTNLTIRGKQTPTLTRHCKVYNFTFIICR